MTPSATRPAARRVSRGYANSPQRPRIPGNHREPANQPLAAYPLVRDGSPVRTQLLSQCHVPPGGRPVPRAGGAVAVGGAVGGPGLPALAPPTALLPPTPPVPLPPPL